MQRISICVDDPTPVYEQVRREVIRLVTSGDLDEGARLPPVRQLARDLGIAPGTVARAYRELEAAGTVTTRRGAGTRIAEGAVDSVAGGSGDGLAVETSALVSRAVEAGITLPELQRRIAEAWPGR
ncbi:GntR family transcriptional regulator [Corynebacterium sp. P5848]|uniref:GntR family transcriptional regulator n=1 Tax=Corynebacterium marambiense TaxID=2765364 RepID=UPI002260D37F|nr:GntR family transcriptional regulator [Corynebacterium marambiense]MCX7543085.1 GntR family transcriptional regulator [Corynebacterium marambiense]